MQVEMEECLTFKNLKVARKTKLPYCPYISTCDGTKCPLTKQPKGESPEDREQEREIQSWLINSSRKN